LGVTANKRATQKRHLKAKVTFIKGYGIDPARCGITWQVVERHLAVMQEAD
jgi:hypothetical protein